MILFAILMISLTVICAIDTVQKRRKYLMENK
jgi:hypothetical protein